MKELLESAASNPQWTLEAYLHVDSEREKGMVEGGEKGREKSELGRRSEHSAQMYAKLLGEA